MKKSKIKLFSILILCIISVIFCGYTKQFNESQSKVYDNAYLFTEYEKEELQKLCISSAEDTKLDIVVATIDDADGKSSRDYADDFYDEMGFGYDQGSSGLILLIDMDNREIYISTAGIAIQYFNDDDIDDILTDMDDYMAANQYYSAALSFINNVNSHVSYINNSHYKEVEPWFNSDFTDYRQYYKKYKKSILANPFIDFVIAAVVSGIIVFCMTLKSKPKMTANCNTYINRDELNVRKSMDTYLRTSVSKTKIQSSSSGSSHSGGSFHSSSSGRSHGGGGHKF